MLHWPGGLNEDAETVTNAGHDASGTQLETPIWFGASVSLQVLQKDNSFDENTYVKEGMD